MTTTFTATRHDGDGHIHIYKSDNEADLIRQAIADLIDDTGATVRVRCLPEGWLKIEVHYPKDITEEDAGLAVDVMENIRRKGWYKVQEEGFSDDGFTDWLVVRHVGGPYV